MDEKIKIYALLASSKNPPIVLWFQTSIIPVATNISLSIRVVTDKMLRKVVIFETTMRLRFQNILIIRVGC